MIQIELPGVTPFRSPGRKGNRYYNPLKEKIEKFKWLVRSQYSGCPLMGPICVIVVFQVGVGATTPPKKKEALISQQRCLRKIDLDNCAKLCWDVLKGMVFEDDSQIWSCSLMKVWGEKSRTLIYAWKDTEDYGTIVIKQP